MLTRDRLVVSGSTGEAPVIAGGEGAVLRPRQLRLQRIRGAIDQCGSQVSFYRDQGRC
jgi:hypothetical protein